MKHLLKISMVIAIVAIAMTGCKKDDDKKEKPTPGGGTMQEIVLQGIVTDVHGAALGGVRVTSGTASTTTTNGGTFLFTEAEIVNKRAVIKFEKNGYFTLTRSGVKQDEMFIEVVLVSKGDSDISRKTTFDASKGTNMKIGKMEVVLPPSAVMRADGSTYNGTVNADMLYLDPNNENFAAMMPGGDLAGIREDESESVLISYGMTNVNLTDNAGNPLQLNGSTPSTLTFPIPAGLENNPPETIPLWSFDEQKGIWIEEGVSTLVGNAYVGTVTHFSWVNCDTPEKVKKIRGLVVDCHEIPVPNIKVTFQASIGETTTYTNSDGEYTSIAPLDIPVTITVVTTWGDSDSVIIPAGGTPGETQTAQKLSVECGVTIKGKVVDCKNNPSAWACVKVGQKELYANNSGEYSTIIAKETPVTVKVVEGSDSEDVPGQPAGTIYKVRDLKFCNDDEGEPETGSDTDKGAIRYFMPDMDELANASLVMTFDQQWKRVRTDSFYETEDFTMHMIMLMDNIAKETWMYYSMYDTWEKYDYSPTEDATQYSSTEEMLQARGFTKEGNTVIIGKLCHIYSGTEDGHAVKYAIWNGLILLFEYDGEVMLRAKAVTLDVPAKFFNKATIDVDWI